MEWLPLSLYGTISSVISSQVTAIALIASSMDNSLLAAADISEMIELY